MKTVAKLLYLLRRGTLSRFFRMWEDPRAIPLRRRRRVHPRFTISESMRTYVVSDDGAAPQFRFTNYRISRGT